MKNVKNSIAVKRAIATLLFTVLFSSSLAATGPRVTAALFSPEKSEIYAEDVPPFVTGEMSGGGIFSEIINAVLQSEKIDGIVTPLPLKRMVNYYLFQESAMAAIGSFEGLTEQQKRDMIFIPIAVISEKYLYYRPAQQNDLVWNGEISLLKPYVYGAQKGSDVTAYQEAGIKVIQGRNHSLFGKLKSGEIDFIAISKPAATWFIMNHFPAELDNFHFMEPYAKELPVYIVFNKKHPKGEQSARRFAAGFSKMVKSGAYLEILQKVYPEDVAQRVLKKLDGYKKR